MSAPQLKAQMLAQLHLLLADVFRLRTEGGAYAKLAQAQGYADGYIRALMDAGFMTQRDVLDLVAKQRQVVDGPATEELTVESVQAA